MNDKTPEKQGMNPWQATGFVWEVLASIAIPTTLCALGGRWLDKRYDASPWFTVVGLVLSLAISFLLVMRKANAYAKKY
jgi:LPXTG-motif cell wall-anchored protein